VVNRSELKVEAFTEARRPRKRVARLFEKNSIARRANDTCHQLQRLLETARDQNLVRIDGQPSIPLKVPSDRIPQSRHTLRRAL